MCRGQLLLGETVSGIAGPLALHEVICQHAKYWSTVHWLLAAGTSMPFSDRSGSLGAHLLNQRLLGPGGVCTWEPSRPPGPPCVPCSWGWWSLPFIHLPSLFRSTLAPGKPATRLCRHWGLRGGLPTATAPLRVWEHQAGPWGQG